jgi:hypothetical protein
MKRYRVYITYHSENQKVDKPHGYVKQLTLDVFAKSHGEAFKVAIALHDDEFGVNGYKLENINIYE